MFDKSREPAKEYARQRRYPEIIRPGCGEAMILKLRHRQGTSEVAISTASAGRGHQAQNGNIFSLINTNTPSPIHKLFPTSLPYKAYGCVRYERYHLEIGVYNGYFLTNK